MVVSLKGLIPCLVLVFGFLTVATRATDDNDRDLEVHNRLGNHRIRGNSVEMLNVTCKEGETVQEDCMRCVCENSQLICAGTCNSKQEAIFAGFNGERRRRSRSKRQTAPLTADLEKTPCAPNDYFQIDCNTCYCKMDRSGYLCTENMACQEVVLPTTTHIPMSEGAVLIISDRGPQLVENINSNDNSLSGLPRSVTETYHTSPLHSMTDQNDNFSSTNTEDYTTSTDSTVTNY